MNTNAIEIHGVRKTFGPKVAVEGLDLMVPTGSVCGFIGPNGAGKTTTIRMVMSILFPDCGDLSVLGNKSALDAKDRIGYLPEERGVYRKMKVSGFLYHMGLLKGVSRSELKQRVPAWLERVGLQDVAKKRCEELSKGMQQKIQFVAAVLHRPELIILDEPFSGLDPVNMRLLRDLIVEEHERGATVIFSTHVMQQAEELCEHIIMIHDGRKVLDGKLEGIRAQYNPQRILVETSDNAAAYAALGGIPGVRSVDIEKRHLALDLEEGAELSKVMSGVLERVTPLRIEQERPSLEDIFVEIVAGKARDGESASELRERLRAGTASDEEVQA